MTHMLTMFVAKTMILCVLFTHVNSNAQEVEKFSLTPGLWEGISEEYAQSANYGQWRKYFTAGDYV